MGKGLGLKRRAGDKIFIGNDIEITVESVVDGCANIFIKAPSDVAIHRDKHYVWLKLAANMKKGH